ncbi:Arc family DNA-binding protein [Microbispora rosea]|uniref:Arc family DNA-binding protein n=1 Tax=Microbispora rosea TaxID=58117 RepID=UPI0037B5DAE2
MTEHEAAWPPEDIELALDHDSDIDSDSEEIYDAKGNLITDEYVRDAIGDVHRAIDEGRVPVPTSRAGRPSLTGESTHSPRVSFRLPEELRERARARAEQEGKSVSALAREAFEQFLKRGEHARRATAPSGQELDSRLTIKAQVGKLVPGMDF